MLLSLHGRLSGPRLKLPRLPAARPSPAGLQGGHGLTRPLRLPAVPEEFDGGPEQAHGGMAAGAAWLLDRFLPLAKARGHTRLCAAASRPDVPACIRVCSLRMLQRVWGSGCSPREIPACIGCHSRRAASAPVQAGWAPRSQAVTCVQGMREAGFTIKICGHSLGGGMAALLGLMLLKRGVRCPALRHCAAPCTLPAARCRDLAPWWTEP